MINNFLTRLRLSKRATVKPEQKPTNDCVIGWGAGSYSVRERRDKTHKVTSIYVDNMSSIIRVVIEKGSEVDVINLSMEHAQEIGFINIKALKPYCK
jgi:hypothetical protein